MVQPFELLREQDIEKLIEYKKFYLVSQTYHRAEKGEKINLLVQGYTDRGLATGHLNVIRDDPYAAVIDLTKAKHKDTLLGMIKPESKYQVFWATVEEREPLETRLLKKFRRSIMYYINTKTNWRPKGKETVNTQLEVIFGELFIIMKYNDHKREIKFEELERM